MAGWPGIDAPGSDGGVAGCGVAAAGRQPVQAVRDSQVTVKKAIAASGVEMPQRLGRLVGPGGSEQVNGSHYPVTEAGTGKAVLLSAVQQGDDRAGIGAVLGFGSPQGGALLVRQWLFAVHRREQALGPLDLLGSFGTGTGGITGLDLLQQSTAGGIHLGDIQDTNH